MAGGAGGAEIGFWGGTGKERRLRRGLGDLVGIQPQQIADIIFHFGVFAFAKMAIDHLPFAVNQVMGWPIAVAIGVPGGVGVILCHWPCHAEIADGFGDVGRVAFKREFGGVDADDNKPLVGKGCVIGLEIGDSADAIDAGIGPEINQHHFAAQTGQCEGVAVMPAGQAGEFGGGVRGWERVDQAGDRGEVLHDRAGGEREEFSVPALGNQQHREQHKPCEDAAQGKAVAFCPAETVAEAVAEQGDGEHRHPCPQGKGENLGKGGERVVGMGDADDGGGEDRPGAGCPDEADQAADRHAGDEIRTGMDLAGFTVCPAR